MTTSLVKLDLGHFALEVTKCLKFLNEIIPLRYFTQIKRLGKFVIAYNSQFMLFLKLHTIGVLISISMLIIYNMYNIFLMFLFMIFIINIKR